MTIVLLISSISMIAGNQKDTLVANHIAATSVQPSLAERNDTVADTASVSCDMSQDSIAADSLDSIPNLPWPQSLQARLDTIMKKSSFLETTQLGLMVYDLTADSVLYARGERQILRPASTMKIVTAVTALDKLGTAYLYKTKLYYKGEIIDSTHVLKGDIYIIGGMDPKLGSDDLRAFASSIKEAGIDTIRGYIYADRSMKDADLLGEGWCWDDDNPVLSPLVYARKDNMTSHFEEYLTKAGVYHDGPTAVKTCPFIKNLEKDTIPISIGDSSTVTKGLLCIRTHTIEQVLQRMMKESDNLYAESMYYQIGLTQGKPATAKKARKVEEALFKKMTPLTLSSCNATSRSTLSNLPHRLSDGSGLSLYNYLTAEIEVAFLRYAYQNPDIYNYLYSSMPVAAKDGTLSKRMRGTAAAHNVHAKTGTLSGISSLAGYCTAANGHILAFTIINQGIMKASPAKTFQDKVCIAMTASHP